MSKKPANRQVEAEPLKKLPLAAERVERHPQQATQEPRWRDAWRRRFGLRHVQRRRQFPPSTRPPSSRSAARSAASAPSPLATSGKAATILGISSRMRGSGVRSRDGPHMESLATATSHFRVAHMVIVVNKCHKLAGPSRNGRSRAAERDRHRASVRCGALAVTRRRHRQPTARACVTSKAPRWPTR
jgi:hypothetical protein